MVMNLIDLLGIFGVVLGIINFILILRFIIEVPDGLNRIANELSKMNQKKGE